MPKPKKPPAYTRHSSGQARVRIDGRAVYLGEYGSPESRERHEEVIAEWFAWQDATRLTLKLDDLALLYLTHAETCYVKGGEATREVGNIRSALRCLLAEYGRTRARDFGPRQLRRFRDALAAKPDDRCRNHTSGHRSRCSNRC